MRTPILARRGLTLVELAIVIVILGVALTLVVTSVGSLVPGERLEAQASGVASAYAVARSLAAATGVPHSIVYDLDEQTYWILAPPLSEEDPDDPFASRRREPDEKRRVDIVSLPSNVEIVAIEYGSDSSVSSGRVQIEVTPLGTTSAHRVRLRHVTSEQERLVVFNPLTGRASIIDGEAEIQMVVDYSEVSP